VAVALFGATITVGAVGLHTIEPWTWIECVWMAVITVTTIGFGEIRPLSDHGRIFMLAYIVGAVGVAGYALSALTAYVADGGFARDLRERRRRNAMDALSGHFIVVGYGRLGSEVTSDLADSGVSVVVIDTEPRPTDAAAPLPRNVHFVHGDGSRDETLREARISAARGIAVATPSSAINVFITLSARQLNPKLTIITRVDDASAEDKARKAGADVVVSPYASAATRISHRLLHQHAAEFVEQMLDRQFRDLMLDDILLPATTEIHGALSELDLRERFGIGIIAIRRPNGELVTVPDKRAHIGAGDVVVAVGSESAIQRFRRAADPLGG
jgi:voltage-gated potassium channel